MEKIKVPCDEIRQSGLFFSVKLKSVNTLRCQNCGKGNTNYTLLYDMTYKTGERSDVAPTVLHGWVWTIANHV